MGMKPASREDKPAFAFMHDKSAPVPLQLERIEEDATLRGAWAACALPKPATAGKHLQTASC